MGSTLRRMVGAPGCNSTQMLTYLYKLFFSGFVFILLCEEDTLEVWQFQQLYTLFAILIHIEASYIPMDNANNKMESMNEKLETTSRLEPENDEQKASPYLYQ